MRKIFIDGGGHRATSVRYFRKGDAEDLICTEIKKQF